jgi:hypothetical protein
MARFIGAYFLYIHLRIRTPIIAYEVAILIFDAVDSRLAATFRLDQLFLR